MYHLRTELGVPVHQQRGVSSPPQHKVGFPRPLIIVKPSVYNGRIEWKDVAEVVSPLPGAWLKGDVDRQPRLFPFMRRSETAWYSSEKQ